MSERQGRSSTATFVVLGRVLLLLLAAGATLWALLAPRRPAGEGAGAAADDAAATAAAAVVHYGCPMHRDVTSAVPGKCSVCGMALVPLHAGLEGGAAPTGHDLSLVLRLDMTTIHPRTFLQQVRAPAAVDDDGAVSAVFYKDEVEMLAPDERATFVPSAAPTAGIEVHVAGEPPAAWDASTVRVRFRAARDDDGAGPRPGQAGWVVLSARQHQSLVVPDAALIQSAAGPYVLVASPDDRTFRKQPVEIGKDFNGLGAVVSGLAGGERMAVESAFFLDAERRLGSEHAPQ
jgi:hypothetical protein